MKVSGFLSIRQVVQFTTKSKPTVYRWVRMGIFPRPVRLGPGSVAWRAADVEEWAADPGAWATSEGGEK